MGDFHHRFCTPNDGDKLQGYDNWVIVDGDTTGLECSGADCEVYKRSSITSTIQARNLNIFDYHVNPQFFSASMEMKRVSISDRGIFGFFISKSEYCNESDVCATAGGLALYGYDDDNTDLYVMAWNQSSGGCAMQWTYLVNLESIGIDPYEYHTYRYMADLLEHPTGSNPYGWYDGVTIDGVGTVCPPHDNDHILNLYHCGDIWSVDIHSLSDSDFRGRNITIYNILENKKYNSFPKWRKTSAGMRPTY